MWYIYNKLLLFNHEKEGKSASCYNTDGPWKHAKWDKSDKERKYCMATFIYIEHLKTELWKKRKEKWLPGAGEMGRCLRVLSYN